MPSASVDPQMLFWTFSPFCSVYLVLSLRRGSIVYYLDMRVVLVLSKLWISKFDAVIKALH